MNDKTAYGIFLFYFFFAFIIQMVAEDPSYQYQEQLGYDTDTLGLNETYLEGAYTDSGWLTSSWNFARFGLNIVSLYIQMASLSVDFFDSAFWNLAANMIFIPLTYVSLIYGTKWVIKLKEALV